MIVLTILLSLMQCEYESFTNVRCNHSANVRNDGRIVRRSYNVQEETAKGSNVQKETENVQKTLRTYSFGNVTNVQCYNCNEKGHYARNCPKPRVWDSNNVRNDGRIVRRSYNVQEETAKGSNVQKETENVQKTLRTYSFGNVTNVQCYNCNEKGHYARNCPKPRLEELSANICMMARILPANTESDEGPSYDSAFISEVQKPSTSYMNLLFSDSDHEQKYPAQPKIINYTIGDDQINSDIIFDDPNVDVNNGIVEYNKNAHDSYELVQ
ncbi:integrase, catalytic region, zinc finger, CCHC-type containing protein [Tanacetum coccineum]